MKKIFLLFSLGFLSMVQAATLTNTLTINGWVEAACTSNLANPQAITFTFVGSTAPTFATNTLNITCTTNTPYQVVLYSGNGATKPTASTFALLNPTLSNPASYPIAYMVESGNTGSAVGNDIWSSVAQGSPVINGTGSGAVQEYAFSIVPSAAGVSYPAGNYQDVLTFNTIY